MFMKVCNIIYRAYEKSRFTFSSSKSSSSATTASGMCRVNKLVIHKGKISCLHEFKEKKYKSIYQTPREIPE